MTGTIATRGCILGGICAQRAYARKQFTSTHHAHPPHSVHQREKQFATTARPRRILDKHHESPRIIAALRLFMAEHKGD